MTTRILAVSLSIIWLALMLIAVDHSLYRFGLTYTIASLAATGIIVWIGNKLWEVRHDNKTAK
jgi:hypothetical protein